MIKKRMLSFILLIGSLLVCGNLVAQDKKQSAEGENENEHKAKIENLESQLVGVWKYNTSKSRSLFKRQGIDSRVYKDIIAAQRDFLLTLHEDQTFEFRAQDKETAGKWSVVQTGATEPVISLSLVFDEDKEIEVNVLTYTVEFSENMDILTFHAAKQHSFVLKQIREVTEKKDNNAGADKKGGN
jgi:hypothetical protein